MDSDITTTTDSGAPDQLVIGLAIGIPCGLIILLLAVLICVVLCVTLLSSRDADNVEAMYMRRRFQGLSLEEQRKRQTIGRGNNKFVQRRRSSAHSPASAQATASSKARVIRANPFGLQDWQLKLSGIDIAMDGENEQTELEDSPRSPFGALNPLLLQHNPDDQVRPSYEPVHKPQKTSHRQKADPSAAKSMAVSLQVAADGGEDEDDDGGSSDSFNPYD